MVYATVNGQLVEENRGGTVTEYVPDTLGSVIQTTNASGTQTSSATYWSYGETRTSTGTNPSPWNFVGNWGYYLDYPSLASGPPPRYYIRARDYRPDLSRWLTTDPLWPKELGSGYAVGSPIVLIDPSGLTPQSEFWACFWHLLGSDVIVSAKDACHHCKSHTGSCVDCDDGYFNSTPAFRAKLPLTVAQIKCLGKCVGKPRDELLKCLRDCVADYLEEKALGWLFCKKYPNECRPPFSAGGPPCDDSNPFQTEISCEACADQTYFECMAKTPRLSWAKCYSQWTAAYIRCRRKKP